MLYAQNFPITSGNVDKFLSLDPLTLAMIVVVFMALAVLATLWFTGKSRASNDKDQSLVIQFLMSKESPMVQAIQLGNQRSEEIKKAIDNQTASANSLIEKTDEQTTEVKGMRKDQESFRGLIAGDLSRHDENIVILSASVVQLTATFSAGIEEVKAMVNQKMATSDGCAALEAKLDLFKVQLLEVLSTRVKLDTREMQRFVLPDTSKAEAGNSVDL